MTATAPAYTPRHRRRVTRFGMWRAHRRYDRQVADGWRPRHRRVEMSEAIRNMNAAVKRMVARMVGQPR